MFCEGSCGNAFHIQCIGISEKNFTDMNVSGKLAVWKCEMCESDLTSQKETVILNQVSEQTNLLSETELATPKRLTMEEKIDLILQKQLSMEVRIESLTKKLNEALLLNEVKDATISELQRKISEGTTAEPDENSVFLPSVKNQKNQESKNKVPKKSYSQALPRGKPSNSCAQLKVSTPNANIERSKSIISTASEATSVSEAEEESSKEDASKNRDIPPVNNNKQDDEGFTTVTYKKRRAAVVRGNGPDNQNFQCAKEKIWVFLGRCLQETTSEHISAFLGSKYAGRTFVVEDLNSKGYFKSFKIGADKEISDDMYNASNWPAGALIKRYLFRRQPAQFHKAQDQ